jgi:hypothetical protein
MNSTDVFAQISELSGEAEWTLEELDAALREAGVDPNRLVNMVMEDVRPLLGSAAHDAEYEGATLGEALPLIGMLKNATGLSLTAIAKAINVTSGFLSEIARHPKALPESWREEITTRAARALNVDATLVRESMMRNFPQVDYALREASHSADAATYRGILDRSGMAPKDKQFWLNLAAQESSG